MRNKLVLKNSGIGIICQVLDVILGFIVRKMFIQYIGLDMLGVNGTFTSILNTLSLAELGFESAVIFSLYKPMRENDKETVENIVYILKRIYELVGIFIIVAGAVIAFFLKYILKGIEMTPTVYIVFALQLLGTAVTYFLAYKRTFLLALQKDYIRNLFISGIKIAATTIQIFLILKFKSFILYSAVSIVQNFLTNFAVAKYVDITENYSFKRRKIDKNLLKNLLSDVKEIFFGKIAGYIYSSTDNLVISTFVSTVSVGLLGNYTQILYQMKNVVSNVLNSTKPIIGHFLASEPDKDHSFDILSNYTFARYVVAMVLLVPGYILCDCFIAAWLGTDYVLPKAMSLLLVSDIFIHFVHGALVDYIAGLGYFKHDRKISVIGAIINIVLSIGLVQVIGMPGVLIGTVVSQVFFWISRSVIIWKEYFEKKQKYIIRYWRKCVIYILLFYAAAIGGFQLFKLLPMADSYLKFIIGGVITEAVVILLIVLVFFRTKEFKYFLQMVKGFINKRKK